MVRSRTQGRRDPARSPLGRSGAAATGEPGCRFPADDGKIDRRVRRRSARLLAAGATLLGCACGALLDRDPAPVRAATWERLGLPFGWVRVSAGECDTLDGERMAAGARATFEAFAEAYPERRARLRLEGLRVLGQADPHTRSGRPVYGLYLRSRDLVLFRCGYENVLRHELVHHYCSELELPCDCKRMDHPGGYDLHCRPLP